MVNDTERARGILLRIFVFLLTYLVVLGWGLSAIKALNWMFPLAAIGLAGAVLVGGRLAGSLRNLWRGAAEPLSFWPTILVGMLAFIAAILYPPTMLDSLTYRLPRIWLWLQEGRIHHILSAEPRLNYMPQVWELATLPLVQLAGDRLVWVWTFGSWMVLHWVAYDWALDVSREVNKARRMAFIASTSTFAVLQACSSASDLFATALVVLSLRYVVAFEQTRDWRHISWAVLSLGLTAGAKPHFSVLVLPLAIWFLAAPSKPWRAFRWAWAPVLIPLWLLCSPAPTFALNYRTYGTWAGPGQDHSMTGEGPAGNLVLGTTMVVWQSVQPPVNPLATTISKSLAATVAGTDANKLVPRFSLRVPLLQMVDSAAMGLVLSVLMVAGIGTALRRDRRLLISWRGLALLAGLLGIGLALSRFVSGSSGRAFTGFLYLALPLALVGWQRLTARMLQLGVYFSLGSSLLALVFNPARPLWPAAQVQRMLTDSPRFHRFAEMVDPYLLFQERATTGEKLARAIPANESVVVINAEDRPLLPLFQPYSRPRTVLFLPPQATPAELKQRQANYVIVCPTAEENYPELCDYVERSGAYEMVLAADYTSKLNKGAETWRLYRRARLPRPALPD